MEQHVKILGILHIVFGSLGILLALGMLLLFGGIAGLIGATDYSSNAHISIPILGRHRRHYLFRSAGDFAARFDRRDRTAAIPVVGAHPRDRDLRAGPDSRALRDRPGRLWTLGAALARIGAALPLRRKLLTAAYWTVPSILCLALYWPGLLAWFQQDDFVWLNLPNQAHGWDGLLRTLFQPTQQGTWRPLSERAFFLAFGAMFGSDALPYRIWVFLTMFANLALPSPSRHALTRSRAAGFWAAILWVVNSKLATVMSWTCEYILVACGFFLLLALHFFLRYVETGERRYYVWTWAAFLTGFLAMETNIVFPALAGSYALLCARGSISGGRCPSLRRRRSTAFCTWCWRPTRAHALHHAFRQRHSGHLVDLLAPVVRAHRSAPPVAFPAGRHRGVDGGLHRCAAGVHHPPGAAEAMAGAGLVGLVLHRAGSRGSVARPHHGLLSDAARHVPGDAGRLRAGLGLAQGTPDLEGLECRAGGRLLMQHAPVGWRIAEWYRERSEAQEALVLGVARAHELHPDKVILLDGIDDYLFWGAIRSGPFLFLRIPDVYLTPGSEAEHFAASRDGRRIQVRDARR
jgi:hypothetical protein